MGDESSLTLTGFIGFLDPAKPSAKPSIEALQALGIRIKVLTGDNEIVTKKICRDVGIPFQHILLGTDLEQLDDEALGKQLEEASILAKLSPTQKARVVRVLQTGGHTVGFMGDGINDAAALRGADVGISVDTAVDIAKESADIILLEKDLMVLRKGVIYGRRTFGNIIKYIKMTASSNFGNMFSMLGASALLPFLPMLPLQLLVQNLLYDLSQTAIPWDRMDKEYIEAPKKWDASGIARFMVWIGAHQFDIRLCRLRRPVLGLQGEQPGPPKPVPVRLVCGGSFVPNPDRAPHPYAQDPLYPKLGDGTGAGTHHPDHGRWGLSCRSLRWPPP